VFNHLKIKALETNSPAGPTKKTTIDDDEAIKEYVFENCYHPLHEIVLKARKV
jgi:hypothetical protein